ncbi:MAG: hypothetical protein FWH03_07490 [Firmicutes bacterium]|nr:hypothetical protein [Bacillota bacterium]
MVRKKYFLIPAILLVCTAVLSGCGNKCQVIYDDSVRISAHAAINFYVQQTIQDNDLESTLTLEELPLTPNTLRVVAYAQRVGYEIDTQHFLSRFTAYFTQQYPTFEALCVAPPARIYIYAEMLHNLSISITNFQNYNLEAAISILNTFENPSAYDIGAMLLMWMPSHRLEPYDGVNLPLSRTDLINITIAAQNDDGGWGVGYHPETWQPFPKSNTDETAAVLAGLNLFMHSYLDHSNPESLPLSEQEALQARQQGLSFLATQKNADGTYQSAWAQSSSSSTAMVMVALHWNETYFFLDDAAKLLIEMFEADGGGFKAEPNSDFADVFSTVDVLRVLAYSFRRHGW